VLLIMVPGRLPWPTHPLTQAEDLKDKLLRTLADMENLRERTARTTAETKQFAVQVGPGFCWPALVLAVCRLLRHAPVAHARAPRHHLCAPHPPAQGLVKNLLEVADNLERAAGSVPPEDVQDGSEIDRERALKLLRSLREGVLMTDTVLLKVREGAGGADRGRCRAGLQVAGTERHSLNGVFTTSRSTAGRACCCAGPVAYAESSSAQPATRCLRPPQVLAREGVTRYDPLGDVFDPNLHNALFEVPDATKEPGTIAVVVKVGGGWAPRWFKDQVMGSCCT
jgi:molecular chaperone GrpE (heat shock protein)